MNEPTKVTESTLGIDERLLKINFINLSFIIF